MNRATSSRAFTLIELLVVILILAVVIAIIVPALGGARNAAKGVSSRSLLTQVANAASAFVNDNDRLPGYFSAEEMGDAENDKRGFTEMENILLDLAGGVIPGGGTGIGGVGGSDGIKVGPTSAAAVWVDPALIGADTEFSKAYFTPDAKSYRTGTGQMGESEHTDELPDLVDAWGTPALAWRRNTFGPTRITGEADFAQIDSGDPAWFYWNSNAGFLNSATVGKLTRSQTTGSIIGADASNPARIKSLVGFLGSPAYPDDLTGTPGNLLPTAARGDLVFHSAGADGFYLGRTGKGAKQFSGDPGSPSFAIEYARNFFSASGKRLTGDGGEGETEDILQAFDDLIQTGN
ncbi:MAG: type II secretion system protein [Phycisphaerales bacterium JB039]